MAYSAAAIATLALQCAPTVAPETVAAIVRTESRGHVLALNVNGGRQPERQTSSGQAAATAKRYIAAGYSVDLGLGQINSRNMRWLGLTWKTVFEPCTNIAALGRVLTQNYNAVRAGRDPQTALRVALSMYNTGSQSRGFRNGYVAKVIRNAGIINTQISDAPATLQQTAASDADLRAIIAAENTARQPLDRPAPPPRWNLFERATYDRETRILADNERGAI